MAAVLIVATLCFRYVVLFAAGHSLMFSIEGISEQGKDLCGLGGNDLLLGGTRLDSAANDSNARLVA